MTGGPGNDTLNGGPGNDQLEAGDEYGGTSGNDILNGNGGNDGLSPTPGADQLNGGDGNDLLVSSAAPCQGHRFDGGGGPRHRLLRAHQSARRALDHDRRQRRPRGLRPPDQILYSNEDLEGSEGADNLVGDSGNNTLFGPRRRRHLQEAWAAATTIEAIDDERDELLDCGGPEKRPSRPAKAVRSEPEELLGDRPPSPGTPLRRPGERSGRDRSRGRSARRHSSW